MVRRLVGALLLVAGLPLTGCSRADSTPETQANQVMVNLTPDQQAEVQRRLAAPGDYDPTDGEKK